MNSANVEEVVKQVLGSMLKTPVSAAPAAASKSQAIPETAHVAMLTARNIMTSKNSRCRKSVTETFL